MPTSPPPEFSLEHISDPFFHPWSSILCFSDSFLTDIAKDEHIKDPRLKCELVDVAIQYDDLEKPGFLDQFNGGQCQQYNPDDWRQTWYESFNEPW